MLKNAVNTYSRMNRDRKATFVAGLARQHSVQSVLFVGVAPTLGRGIENIAERRIMELLPKATVMATGLEYASTFDWPGYQQADALNLPFGAGDFDLVFSNAVIEHVGGEKEQRRFVEEHARVGRHWALTTPNRSFPIESHSYAICRHWLKAWSHPGVTRLLTRRDLCHLLSGTEGRVRGWQLSPTFIATRFRGGNEPLDRRGTP